MQLSTQITPIFSSKGRVFILSALQVVLGSLFLAICSQVTIPLQPVPITLQTLAIALLAITQGGRTASLSVILYLVEATMGMPVLAGGISNPLWLFFPNFGYLLSFPIAAYLTGKMVELKDKPSLHWIVFSMICSNLMILLLGTIGLAQFIGLKKGIVAGFLPFLPTMVLKVMIASTLSGFCLRWKARLSL